jgi:hypothetical protein
VPKALTPGTAWQAGIVVSGARGRREAIRQLADTRRWLEAAEQALAEAQAARKEAEEAYDAANDRFTEIERALDEARAERDRARRARYAARQEHEQLSALVARLQRRERELAERPGGPGVTGAPPAGRGLAGGALVAHPCRPRGSIRPGSATPSKRRGSPAACYPPARPLSITRRPARRDVTITQPLVPPGHVRGQNTVSS